MAKTKVKPKGKEDNDAPNPDEVADDSAEQDTEEEVDEDLEDEESEEGEDDREEDSEDDEDSEEADPNSPEDEGEEGEDAQPTSESKVKRVEDLKALEHVIEQENYEIPVPGYGYGTPTPGPTDKGPMKAKGRTDKREPRDTHVAIQWQVRAAAEDKLPDGICGRISGIALQYDVVDTYNTAFSPGCLDRTRTEKLQAGKIQLYANLAFDGSGSHSHSARTHVGTVRTLVDSGNRVLLTADLFDTDDGRRVKEYLEAVTKSGGSTGLSIGFRNRGSDKEMRTINGKVRKIEVFRQIELAEVTVTPMPSVPGTGVTSVRSQAAMEQLLMTAAQNLGQSRTEEILQSVFAAPRSPSDRDDASREDSPTPKKGDKVSMDSRVRAVRASYVHRR